MHLSAMAYNLKKHLKFIQKTAKSKAKAQVIKALLKNVFYELIFSFLSKPNFTSFIFKV